MKTTIDLPDALAARARRHARKTGRTLRGLVEEGLRRVMEDGAPTPGYRLPDLSVGDAASPDPLAELSWPELRDEIYGPHR
jgi:hypothetical protein